MDAETKKKNIKTVIFIAGLLFVLVLVLGAVFLFQKNRTVNVTRKNIAENIPGVSPVESKQEKAPLYFTFFGDMMLDRSVGSKIKQKGLEYLFEKLATGGNNIFQNQDLVSCNLEGAVTNSGQHYPPFNRYDFAFSPEIVAKLKDYGFNFFNLANNHFADQGQRGIDETRQNLDSLGFNYSGCPDGQIGDCSTKIIEIKNQKIGLVGFSAVYQELDLDNLKDIVKKLKTQSDFVVVNFHWGSEYQHKFSPLQQKYAHALIDTGADLVVGHHPHVVQGLEIYKGKSIFYSLGNFIFDQYFSADTQRGLSLSMSVGEQQIEFQLIPFQSKQNQPALLSQEQKTDFLQKFVSWSQADADILEQIKQGALILSR